MDQGINLPFSSQGIDDATFGLPTFADGWKQLVVTGSSQRALRDNKGGRLLLHVKCVNDPSGQDTGKDHIISLNLWHNEQSPRDRAASELATIMRAMNNGVDWAMQQGTMELYNRPFLALASTQTPAPTPEYPNPQAQTNWRGYDFMGGPKSSGAGAGSGPGNNPPNFGAQQGGAPNFNQQGQQPQQQQGGGNWGNQPQQQPQQNNGWNGNNGQGPQGGGAQSPQSWGGPQSGAPQGGGVGGQPNAPQSGNPGGWGGQNAPNASPSNGQQQNNGGWGPQGGQQPQQQTQNPAPWGNG